MMMMLSRAALTTRRFAVTRGFASVGDKVPNVELHHQFPPEKVNLTDYCADKSVILLGLPGAFTPTWSTEQIPNYLSNQDALKKLGVDSVVVWCVNDSAVMQAWAENQNIGQSMLKFMGDPSGELTKELDMELTHEGPRGKGLFGRCKRHALHIVNGEIKAIRISEKPDDPAGDDDPSLTLVESMIEAMESE